MCLLCVLVNKVLVSAQVEKHFTIARVQFSSLGGRVINVTAIVM